MGRKKGNIVTTENIDYVKNYIKKKSIDDEKFREIYEKFGDGYNATLLNELINETLDSGRRYKLRNALKVKKHRWNYCKVSVEMDIYLYEQLKKAKEELGAKTIAEAIEKLLKR